MLPFSIAVSRFFTSLHWSCYTGVVDQISHSVSAALDWKHLIEAVRFVVIHSIYAIFYVLGAAVFALPSILNRCSKTRAGSWPRFM